MKLFHVIAFLCTLLVVVNGEIYTFKLDDANFDNDKTVQIYFDNSITANDMEWDLSEGKYILRDIELSSFGMYYYRIDSAFETAKNFGDINSQSVLVHPCVSTQMESSGVTPQNFITRKFQDGKFVYDDVNGEPPACNVGSIQCGEFVYEENDERIDTGVGPYYCRSVSSNKISTLKSLLANSTEFDASCNPN